MTEPTSSDSNEPRGVRVFVTVAVCTRNRAGSLEAAVKSVIPQLTSETELLIIDNASTDDTPKMGEQFARTHPNVRIWREERLGVAFARNAALREARGEYVLFFDDDELADSDWLATYLAFLRETRTTLGAVGGASLREEPAPDWVHHSFGQVDLGGESRRLTTKATPGAGNCAYHRNRALTLGGFDPALFRAEDSDLNDRLRLAGYEIWWLPAARVRHRIPSKRYRFKSQMRIAFDEGRAASAMRRKRFGWGVNWIFYILGRVLVMPFHIACELVAAIGCLLVGRRAAGLRLLLRIGRNLGMASGWVT